MSRKKIKLAIYVDFLIVAYFLIMIVWSSVGNYVPAILGPIFFLSLGILTIFSEKYKDALFTEKIIYWIVSNTFKPKTKFNHFIWGAFITIVGLLSIFFIEDTNSDIYDLRTKLLKDKSFWLLLIIILLIILCTGIYTARRTKKTDYDSRRKKDNRP